MEALVKNGGIGVKKTKIAAHIFIYSVFMAFCIWMAAQIPYTHDDWDWGISNGIEQLLGATLNARYVGNFFVVIMTRSKFLKTLIMGMGYFLIPYGLSSLAVWKQTEESSISGKNMVLSNGGMPTRTWLRIFPLPKYSIFSSSQLERICVAFL